jgi:hypothetical protein
VQLDVVCELATTAQEAVFLFPRKRSAYPPSACGLFFFTHSMYAPNV